jgi:tetratricopeptide (TPR) repeat protein
MRPLPKARLVLLGLNLLLLPIAQAQSSTAPQESGAFESSAQRQERIDRIWERWADHLPDWCKYTMLLPDPLIEGTSPGWGDPRGEPYKAAFGGMQNFEDVHHYCRGLNDLYEGSRASEDKREYWFNEAVREIDYVLQRTDLSFVLRPEMYYKKGVALMTLGKPIEAVEMFTAALRTRSDYEPAYLSLSQYFERAGDMAEAKRLVEEGLRWIPDSTHLTQRLTELKRSGNARASRSGAASR